MDIFDHFDSKQEFEQLEPTKSKKVAFIVEKRDPNEKLVKDLL